MVGRPQCAPNAPSRQQVGPGNASHIPNPNVQSLPQKILRREAVHSHRTWFLAIPSALSVHLLGAAIPIAEPSNASP
jgi:hypothetical protein